MVCHLFGNNPLSEPMLHCCQFDPWEQSSVNLYSDFKTFSFKKMLSKMSAMLSWPQCVNNDLLTGDNFYLLGSRWQTSIRFEQKCKIFIQENVKYVACKMVTILFKTRCIYDKLPLVYIILWCQVGIMGTDYDSSIRYKSLGGGKSMLP